MMKSRLKEIKDNHEFRKGEGWEITTLSEDIDWLIKQAEKVEYLEKRKEEILVESGKRWTKLLMIQDVLNLKD